MRTRDSDSARRPSQLERVQAAHAVGANGRTEVAAIGMPEAVVSAGLEGELGLQTIVEADGIEVLAQRIQRHLGALVLADGVLELEVLLLDATNRPNPPTSRASSPSS